MVPHGLRDAAIRRKPSSPSAPSDQKLTIRSQSTSNWLSRWPSTNGWKPGVPDAAVVQADRTVGKQIGGVFGRRSSGRDKNVGFWEIETWRIAVCGLGGRDLCSWRTSRFLLG